MKIEIMNESHRDKVLELSKAFLLQCALDHEVPMILQKQILMRQ